MVRGRGEIYRRIMEIAEHFRQKGATSPEKAMTLQELELPLWFEQAMHRRLGQLGIFNQVNGKYYLNEERLRELEARYFKAGAGGKKYNRSHYVGILLMLPIGLIVSTAIFYALVFSRVSFFPGGFLIILTIVMLIVAAFRILYWRSIRRYWR
ncbi:MAG: hypothetical protein QXI39_02485 [Candidatus Bathyarchaeia archaeon]